MECKRDTHLFSSTSSKPLPAPTLALLARRFSLSLLLRRASRPVVKSASRTWTKNSPPAKGQIESEVVAEVSVPSMGESRESNKGGRSRGRRGVGAGTSGAACQIRISLVAWCSFALAVPNALTRVLRDARIGHTPAIFPYEVANNAKSYTPPTDGRGTKAAI